jgi:hypothetical protein
VQITAGDLDIDGGDLNMNGGDIVLANGNQISAAWSSGTVNAITMQMTGTYDGIVAYLTNNNASATDNIIHAVAFGTNAAVYAQTGYSGGFGPGIGVEAIANGGNANSIAITAEQSAGFTAIKVVKGDIDVVLGDLNMLGGNINISDGYGLSGVASTVHAVKAIDLEASGTFPNRLVEITQTNASSAAALVYIEGNHDGSPLEVKTTGTNGSASSPTFRSTVTSTPAIYVENNTGGEPLGLYIATGDLKTDKYMTMLDWGGTFTKTPPSGYGRFYTNSDGTGSGEIEPHFADDSGNTYSLKPTLPTSYIHDFSIETSIAQPLTQVVLGIGTARSSDDSTDMTTSTTIALDLSVSGLNGLDEGTEQASTWYYVWVIHNPSTSVTQGLISTSYDAATGPNNPPSGYTKWTRVGTFRNDSGSDIIPFRQGGTQHDRTYIFLSSFASRNVLTDGAATSATQIDVSAFVPPVSFTADLTITQAAARTTYYLVTDTDPIVMEITESTVSYSNAPLYNDQTFYYYTSGSAGETSIWVRGWRENL